MAIGIGNKTLKRFKVTVEVSNGGSSLTVFQDAEDLVSCAREVSKRYGKKRIMSIEFWFAL